MSAAEQARLKSLWDEIDAAVTVRRRRFDAGGSLVGSGVALLVIAGALIYLPLGLALLGLALVAAGIGVMRA